MSQALLIGVAVLSLAFAPAPLPRRNAPRNDDFQRIQGTWVVLGAGGPDVPANERWVFGAGKLEIRAGDSTYQWEYVIDPRTVPRALDMTYSPNGRDVSQLKAVYSLDGDRLLIGYEPGAWGRRPERLDEKDTSIQVMRFRRESR